MAPLGGIVLRSECGFRTSTRLDWVKRKPQIGAADEIATQLESRVMRAADSVVVPHSKFREQLVQNLQVEPAKITNNQELDARSIESCK